MIIPPALLTFPSPLSILRKLFFTWHVEVFLDPSNVGYLCLFRVFKILVPALCILSFTRHTVIFCLVFSPVSLSGA